MSMLPVDFMLILLGLFAAAVIITFIVCTLRRIRVLRLKDLHRDYNRKHDHPHHPHHTHHHTHNGHHRA